MKKMAALAVLTILALAATQPALAGVGGCKIPGVGGCGGAMLTQNGRQVSNTPSILDGIGLALPADVLAFLRAKFDQKNGTPTVVEAPETTTNGVGGCFVRPGVGGCAL